MLEFEICIPEYWRQNFGHFSWRVPYRVVEVSGVRSNNMI